MYVFLEDKKNVAEGKKGELNGLKKTKDKLDGKKTKLDGRIRDNGTAIDRCERTLTRVDKVIESLQRRIT